MAKDIAKRAGAAAIEKTLQALLPELVSRLDAMHRDISDLRKEMDYRFSSLQDQLNAKTERTQELINELGLRVNTVGTRLDTYFEFARRDSAKVDLFLERLVRVEEAQKPRLRIAGKR